MRNLDNKKLDVKRTNLFFGESEVYNLELNKRNGGERRQKIYRFIARLLLTGLLVIGISAGTEAQSPDSSNLPGGAGESYPQMPSIAPIGVRTGRYLDVPVSAQGPAIDPA